MKQEPEIKELRVLLLEDTPTDAELMEHELRKAGIALTSKRVETREAFVRALGEFRPDIVLSDYHLPEFDGKDALNIVHRDYPEVPVIMVTGALPDIEAVELMHAGAKDYVLKDRLARLAPAVLRVLSAEKGARARKLAEEELRRAHFEWTAALDAMHDPVFMHDREYRLMRCNRAYVERARMPVKDVLGKLYWEVFPRREGPLSGCVQALQGAKEEQDEIQLASGEIFVSRSFSVRNDEGSYLFSLHIMEDITERKRAEKEVHRLNRTLRALSAGNHALVHGETEQSLLDNMCRAVTEVGYALAWVGYALQDEKKSIVPMAMAGDGKAYIEALHITWDDQPAGRVPTGTAVRTGQTQISQDIRNDPFMAPWRDEAAKHGYVSTIALPLKENEEIIGVLTLYAAELDAFGVQQVALLEEMAGDLAFGIVNLRTRRERDRAIMEREHYVERLGANLEQTLLAISATVEMRDPYTAGHQRRVAQLAVAIARELGLPEEQIHGIHLAGIVHDLGKIRVPAEILSKPGELSKLEFKLIQTHPEAGYDILKGIEFPWPIAQAVLQHHEHLDGSGYPHSQQAGKILLEAKILAVADTVEAMSSHRPYRPGLGLEAALEEIARQRGVHYDPAVVDSCLALFREKRFVFG